MMKVYLDVCCLNRLFDDQRQLRVATEAAAVQRLLQLIESSSLTDYSSEMAKVEISRIKDMDRRWKVTALLPPRERILMFSDALLDEAEKLSRLGFGVADAVHLAAAARLKVDVFLSVDEKLVRRGRQNAQQFSFRVLNPVKFLEECDDAANG